MVGHFSTPITPESGSFLHADSQSNSYQQHHHADDDGPYEYILDAVIKRAGIIGSVGCHFARPRGFGVRSGFEVGIS